MRIHATKLVVVAAIAAGLTSFAGAESIKFDALVTQKEAIRLDFADASKHYFALVRREGKSEGQGPLAGAIAQEFGAHDNVPGIGGEPRGYLEFTRPDGDKAYIKFIMEIVYLPGPTESRMCKLVACGRLWAVPASLRSSREPELFI